MNKKDVFGGLIPGILFGLGLACILTGVILFMNASLTRAEKECETIKAQMGTDTNSHNPWHPRWKGDVGQVTCHFTTHVKPGDVYSWWFVVKYSHENPNAPYTITNIRRNDTIQSYSIHVVKGTMIIYEQFNLTNHIKVSPTDRDLKDSLVIASHIIDRSIQENKNEFTEDIGYYNWRDK